MTINQGNVNLNRYKRHNDKLGAFWQSQQLLHPPVVALSSQWKKTSNAEQDWLPRHFGGWKIPSGPTMISQDPWKWGYTSRYSPDCHLWIGDAHITLLREVGQLKRDVFEIRFLRSILGVNYYYGQSEEWLHQTGSINITDSLNDLICRRRLWSCLQDTPTPAS